MIMILFDKNDMKRVLYFSCVGWNKLKQRPHFLAEELAKMGCEVTFLTVGAEKNGFFTAGERLTVCESAFVRGYIRSALMRGFARRVIKRALADREFDAVILTEPIQLYMLPEKTAAKPLIYDCMDLVPHFYEGAKRRICERAERSLCERAAAVTVSSKMLMEHLAERYSLNANRLTLINNGFDPFDTAAANGNIQLLRPALIYMGAVESWLDTELLIGFFSENTDLQLYIVGDGRKELTDRFKKLENCHFLGKKAHREALDYVKSADIALLPFKQSELVEMVDPIKLYEYLALGRRTVSFCWKGLKRFESCSGVFFYHDRADFGKTVRQALESGEKAFSSDFLTECSWEERAKVLFHIIDRLCAENNEEKPQ